MELQKLQIEAITELVKECEKRNILFWLYGGWGLDALLHRITRKHRDIDLVVLQEHKESFESLLRTLQYTLDKTEFFGSATRGEVIIEIAAIAGSDIAEPYIDFGRGFVIPLPSNSFEGRYNGKVGECRCHVVSWDFLYVNKLRHKWVKPDEQEPRGKDLFDLRHICSHLPEERRRMAEKRSEPVPSAEYYSRLKTISPLSEKKKPAAQHDKRAQV